ncbi:hypothetical protein BJ970_007520 [Saccharopolyspora phatthalungensis]|uniref:Uncharacterized protein n=1 Tax=Saccharopolyspora phatthalungensis TaxID=664693 RepID=A0A840QIG9_9PSEU|nr:hypothetical protein [Saccharopolyspora phatthalungensis]
MTDHAFVRQLAESRISRASPEVVVESIGHSKVSNTACGS